MKVKHNVVLNTHGESDKLLQNVFTIYYCFCLICKKKYTFKNSNDPVCIGLYIIKTILFQK